MRPEPASQAWASSAEPFRVAVIGAGFIADYHVLGLRAAGAEVVALAGRDPGRTATRALALGLSRAGTVREVLTDEEIEAVVVATPDNSHHPVTLQALAAGKAVLVQKPMAMTSGECRALLAAVDGAPHRLSVSFMHRHFPEVRWLRGLLAEGRLGAVHMVRLRNATPGADWAGWLYRPGEVAGGVVMQLGTHGIDLVQHLLGPIERVTAQARTARPERRLKDGRTVASALEDNVTASYRLAGGVLVSHEMSYTETAGCDRFRLELYAEKGTVWLRSERGAAAIHAPEVAGKKGWVTMPLPAEPEGQHHHAAWIAAARGQGDDTARAGLSAMLVAEAVYRAAASGATEAVERVA